MFDQNTSNGAEGMNKANLPARNQHAVGCLKWLIKTTEQRLSAHRRKAMNCSYPLPFWVFKKTKEVEAHADRVRNVQWLDAPHKTKARVTSINEPSKSYLTTLTVCCCTFCSQRLQSSITY